MDFRKSILYGLSNKKRLAELLKIEKKKLLNVKGEFTEVPFQKVVNGKKRELYNARNNHKQSLKRIVKYLNKIEIPSYIHGGIPKKSYISNVHTHCSNKFAIIVDISNFFPSTSAQRVFDFFRYDMNQSPDIAKILTDLTTVSKDGHSFLPQGYPTSPILSFLAYHKMYESLMAYAQVNALTFTAYYDDLTFSSNKPIPKRCLKTIIKIIESYNLKINQKKTKIRRLNYAKITGCVVVEDKLRAPRKLQQETYNLYKILKNSELSDDELAKILKKFYGKIVAIQMIEKDRRFPNYMKLIEDKKVELEERKNEKFNLPNNTIRKV